MGGKKRDRKEVKKYVYLGEKKGTWISLSNTHLFGREKNEKGKKEHFQHTFIWEGKKKHVKETSSTHVYLGGKKIKRNWKTFQLAGLEPTFSR